MTARRRRKNAGNPLDSLGGRLGVQGMLLLAFTLQLWLSVLFDRGFIETLIAVFGIAVAVVGAYDVWADYRNGLKLRAQLSYEATRANYAESELDRLRRLRPPAPTPWKGAR